MSEGESTAVLGGQQKRSKVGNKDSSGVFGDPPGGAGPAGSAGAPRGGGLLRQYKPEQGKWTRMGTFVGLTALVGWGGYFLYERLEIFSDGPEPWRLVVSRGIPLAVVVLFGVLAWWITYSYRSSSDFMIATEGEMKKVNWSTRREIIGSTKVVILFTVLLAVLLFVVDLSFQSLFSWIGVLKK